MQYSGYEWVLLLLFYALLGWIGHVVVTAVKNKRFVNHGFLNLPLDIPAGLTMAVLVLVLPTMGRDLGRQFLMTWAIGWIVGKLSAQFTKNVSGVQTERSGKKAVLSALLAAGIFLVVYLLVHPFVYTLLKLVPGWVVKTLAVAFGVTVLVDFLCVRHAVRSQRLCQAADDCKEQTQKIGDRITRAVCGRLEKAYPVLFDEDPENDDQVVFAKGICFDKLVWVFLISSFLGAMIEMLYCHALDGVWMNRSSVLYGAFSFVWGFGAVVLTVVLQRLAGKEDRKVFLAGFVVGGAYEYVCSVFTELVFGTVFWDYSEMPLNIGGRTNVVYCVFWGILAVVWIKVLYPPMERTIQRIPPLAGKIVTWVLLFAMACNGLLTAGAMIRYDQRQTEPEAKTVLAQFLDEWYDDAWMEHRWPNMKRTGTK